MPTTTPTVEARRRIPAGPIGPGGDGASGGSEGSGEAAVPAISASGIGVWLLVGAITILFAAFTSTYLARRGQADWQAVPLLPILWVNTAVLLASSGALEWARARGRQRRLAGLQSGLTVATVLGVAFLAGQITAWRQLVAAGFYLATNPHSSFFYLLTGAHGLHLVGGVGALLYTLAKVRQAVRPAQALAVVDPTTVYWHFLGGLWLYLLVILFAL